MINWSSCSLLIIFHISASVIKPLPYESIKLNAFIIDDLFSRFLAIIGDDSGDSIGVLLGLLLARLLNVLVEFRFVDIGPPPLLLGKLFIYRLKYINYINYKIKF